MAAIEDDTVHMSDEELGEKLRLSLGVHVASMIAGSPIVAIGAVTGALSAMNQTDLKKNLAKLPEGGMGKFLAEFIEKTRAPGAEFPHLPVYKRGSTHLTGDASDDDVLPDGQEIDLSGYIMKGDFEDIWPGVELLTTDEAAGKLGIVKSTLHEWFKTGKALKLSREGKRGFRVPAETILDDGTLVKGLAKIIERIGHGSHNLAWSFLTDRVEFHEGEFARPIDLLRDGRIDEVLNQERRWGEMGGS